MQSKVSLGSQVEQLVFVIHKMCGELVVQLCHGQSFVHDLLVFSGWYGKVAIGGAESVQQILQFPIQFQKKSNLLVLLVATIHELQPQIIQAVCHSRNVCCSTTKLGKTFFGLIMVTLSNLIRYRCLASCLF